MKRKLLTIVVMAMSLLWNVGNSEAQSLSGSFASKFNRYQFGEFYSGTPTHTWTEVAWKGERIQHQIILRSESIVNDLTYNVSDLTNSQFHIPASAVTLFFENYVKGDPQAKTCGDYREHKDAVLIADALDKDLITTIAPDDALRIWVSIDVPTNTASGLYSGTITVSGLEFTINLNVVDFVMPPVSDWAFHLDLWQFPDKALEFYNTTHRDAPIAAWSDDHFKLFMPAYRLLADLGQKTITAHIKEGALGNSTMIRWIKRTNGDWQYDFSVFDKFVESLTAIGISKQINCFSPIGWNQTDIPYWDEASGTSKSLRAPLNSSDYSIRWKHFLTEFKKHLIVKKWFGKTVLYLDEIHAEDLNTLVTFIREHDTNWKIGAATTETLSASLSSKIYDLSTILEISSAENRSSLITTFYTSCTQTKPNSYVTPENSTSEQTWLAWHAMHDNLNGYLRWAFDYWQLVDPTDARDGGNTAGDYAFIYRKNNSGEFQLSLRAAMLREGIEDYEKIRVLKKRFAGNLAAMNALDVVLNKFTSFSGANAEALVREGEQVIDDISAGKFGTITSVETEADNAVIIYPNPVKNELVIKLEPAQRASLITISDTQGHVLRTIHIDSAIETVYTLSTHNLLEGIYIVSIQTSQTVITRRIVKQ